MLGASNPVSLIRMGSKRQEEERRLIVVRLGLIGVATDSGRPTRAANHLGRPPRAASLGRPVGGDSLLYPLSRPSTGTNFSLSFHPRQGTLRALI